MDTEYTGPVEIWGTAEFPTKGLWDVHGPFKTEALYANGVHMIVSGEFPNGIKFEGTEGWVFVSRGNEAVTASDPVAQLKDAQALAASDPKIIKSVIGTDEIHLLESNDHHGNWLAGHQVAAAADRARRSRPPRLLRLPAPSHGDEARTRKLYWDPEKERFKNDEQANALLSRPQRAPYALETRQIATAGPGAKALTRHESEDESSSEAPGLRAECLVQSAVAASDLASGSNSRHPRISLQPELVLVPVRIRLRRAR